MADRDPQNPTPPPSGDETPGGTILPRREFTDGTHLGPYELQTEIGRGGMGIVYLAYDTSLNRRLAVKILPHAVSNESRVVQRFLREAQAAARLRHPNIIPIFSAGEIDGTYYYSMEYVPGLSLARILRSLRERKLGHRGILSVKRITVDGMPELRIAHSDPLRQTESDTQISEGTLVDQRHTGEETTVFTFDHRNYVHEALRLFSDVADALNYAHERGVIHRDIKPSNLLLSPDGRLMLADFGLAKIGDARSITRTGDLLGSPSYMSPEQTMTKRIPIDHRTDIWSLGVTLYEFLTLRHPFEARSLEVSLKNITSSDPKPIRKINPRLPKDVETVVEKALQKNPDHRYQRAGDLASDLRAVLNYESIQARSTGPLTRSVRFVRRHTAGVAVAILSLALLVVISLGLLQYQQNQMNDLENGFAYFRGVMRNEPDSKVDETTIREIQEALRERRASTPDLVSAIDDLVFSSIREAEGNLPSDSSEGNLEEAMRSLRKIRLIHLHNPDEIERERLNKVDRATADIRVRLVWALYDSLLRNRALGEQPTNDRRFRWLAHFLGTNNWTDGIPREQNPLVKRNAIDALGRLASRSTYTDAVVQELKRVLNDQEASLEVRAEAVKALAVLSSTHNDPQALALLADALTEDRFFELPALARYKAAEVLSNSPQAIDYTEVFKHLEMDPSAAVQVVARRALANLEQG